MSGIYIPCSECREIAYYPNPNGRGCGYRFCPWCGKRMGGKNERTDRL